MRLIAFDEIDSTNSEAKRLAAKGDFGPLWVTAKTQTRGVGRRGREWVSQPGNLFATGLYPVDGDLAKAARLSFVAALAVYDCVDHCMENGQTKIKWPNDILVNGQKLAGILLESGTDMGQAWVAVGIGINLINAPDYEHRPVSALAYFAPDQSQDYSQVLDRLIGRFEHWSIVYDKDGFAPIRDAWIGCAPGMGGPVTARLVNETIVGTAIGLDVDGALEIKTKSGELVKIHAGDVFFSREKI